VVGPHQLDGLATEDPHAVDLAPARQHVAEPQAVGGGRYKPAATRQERRVLAIGTRQRIVGQDETLVGVTAVQRREPTGLGIRHREPGVGQSRVGRRS
jgi:hypothetical protein